MEEPKPAPPTTQPPQPSPAAAVEDKPALTPPPQPQAQPAAVQPPPVVAPQPQQPPVAVATNGPVPHIHGPPTGPYGPQRPPYPVRYFLLSLFSIKMISSRSIIRDIRLLLSSNSRDHHRREVIISRTRRHRLDLLMDIHIILLR